MKNRLKEFRAIHDTTQAELAKKLQVSRQTIIAIEKNKYDPSLKLAMNMAKFFNIPVEELFLDDEEKKDKKEEKEKKMGIVLKINEVSNIFVFIILFLNLFVCFS
jgi:putative transcriptional regulator